MITQDKIRKLLALAKNNTSPEEAATAYARAVELATLAGLDLEDLEDLAKAAETPEPPRTVESIVLRTLDASTHRRVCTWRCYVSMGVARSCGVGHILQGGVILVYGQPSDLDTASTIYTAIAAQVEDMADRAVSEYRTHSYRDPHRDPSPRAWVSAWRVGCATTIFHRLRHRADVVAQKRAELPTAETVALARIDNAAAYLARVAAAVERFADEQLPRRVDHRALGRISSASGYRDGRLAGERVSLTAKKAIGGHEDPG